MDFNLSDIKFPNFVTGIMDEAGEWFQGGYDYQTQSPGWVRYYVINEVKEINLADMTWQTTAERHKESDWYPVYTFPNGYEIRIKGEFTQFPEQGNYFCGLQANWFDLDGNALGNDHIGDAGYRGFASAATYYPIAYGNMDDGNFVGYMILDTVYYPDANPAAGAPNHGLQFQLLVGNKEYGWVVNPGAGPIRATGGITSLILGGWEDLQKFSTYIHSNGNPFEGDPFSDEPFPGEPAGGDDTSTTGGGHGNYDNTSDPIDFPEVPTNGALVSGGIMAHRVARETLLSIMTDLWDTSLFDISTWQKAITDPVNAIVSLHALPVNPDVEADPNNLFIGNMDMHVNPPKVTSQYKVITFDPVEVKEYWGSALDYSPYTKVEIYLPFIKVQTLAPEDVINNTITIRYHIDVLTGDCIAFIKCGNAVLYRFTGNCKMQIPLTVQSNTAATGIKQAAPQMAAGIATGGAIGLADAAATAAGNVVASKIVTQRSGEIAGSISVMDDFTPYLIIHRPKQSLAKDYNKFKGYPSNITRTLSSLKGYTEVEHINLGVDGATDAELEEIKTLLQNGVII